MFDEYLVYVIDKDDGKTYEYKEIGFLAANGRSGLYNKTGHKSWVIRNDRKYVPAKRNKAFVKEFIKILKEEEKISSELYISDINPELEDED